MNKPVLIYSFYISLICAVFLHIYAYTGFTISWMNFVILALYFGTGSKLKDILAIFLNIGAGLIWGQLNFVFFALVGGMGIPEQLATFMTTVIVTTVAIFVHLRILKNTVFNKLPFIFVGLALTTSQGGNNEIELIITVIAALLLALACSLGESLLWSRPTQKSKAQNN